MSKRKIRLTGKKAVPTGKRDYRDLERELLEIREKAG